MVFYYCRYRVTGWWFRVDSLIYNWWVVSNMAFLFHHIWDVILPIDELIFFKMVIAPPTRYI